jgi:DNA-binding transcriptional LysR family regulator
MDTQNLKAFIAVAEHASFSLAGEQLRLTQPAVSKRIATLESHLGCRLFDRIGRTVRLTESGQALLPRAQKILQSVRDTQQAIHNLSGSISGKLRLATSHHIGLHHLPIILRRFTADFPEVELELGFMDSEQAYEAVHRGDAELAVVTLAPSQPSYIEALPIWQDPLSVVVSPQHPLAHNQKISIEELASLPAILPDLNTYTGQLIQKLFAQKNLKLNLSMATNYLETIKMMVSIGLGWSILPSTMIDQQLRSIEVPALQANRTLGCIHHSERTLSNAANTFLHACKHAGDAPPNDEIAQKQPK